MLCAARQLPDGVRSERPAPFAAQRIEQGAQVVVIEFVHQREQFAQFAARESFARKPAEIMAGQVGDESAFVFPVWHFTGQQHLEVFGFHDADTVAQIDNGMTYAEDKSRELLLRRGAFREMLLTRLKYPLFLVLALVLASCGTPRAPAALAASIERLDIISRAPAFGGADFEGGGQYETIVAVAHMRINPAHPANRIIADIDKAAAPDGWVRYQSDVIIVRPRDPARASKVLLIDLPGSGAQRLPGMANDADAGAAGNGFTMRRGHTMVSIGWQGDIALKKDGTTAGTELPLATNGTLPITGPSYAETIFDDGATTGSMALAYPAASLDQASARLTVRATATAAPTTLPRSAWSFKGPLRIELGRPSGFDAGAIYRFDYLARDPRLMGLGMAAVRDVASFLKSGLADGAGQANPLADIHPDVAVAVGVGQAGGFLRDLIWQGFNQDPRGGKVFEGAMPLVAGSAKSFVNLRFSQPGRIATQHLDHLAYGDEFPFSYGVTTDPASGKTDGIFNRCQASNTCPRLMHVDSSGEFWQARASLVLDDGAGNDIAMPAGVRAYLMSSTQHIAANRPVMGVCRYANNPARQSPTVRVLLDHLVAWARGGKQPPASRYPLHADAMLTAPQRDAAGFPDLGAIGVEYPAVINELALVDFSAPRAVPGAARRYQLFVPMTDVDGHDIAGIRLPDIAVPLATHAGWNLRRKGYADGQLCGLNGLSLPFPATPRKADPRRAISERYARRIEYAKAVALAARALRDQGLLLQEDVERYIERAKVDARINP